MGQLRVWDVTTTDECRRVTGRGPYGTRWIDVNKGDDLRPEYRSRLVVQETRGNSTIAKGDVAAVFAATPPLECLRLVCSLVMSGDPSWVIRFLDISRAHPHCETHRNIYIRLPQEDPSSGNPDTCGKLRMALYGTRDAGQNFELKVHEVVTGAGCIQGVFSPCVYRHPVRKLFFFHHGDDFVVAGPRDESVWLVLRLGETFIVKDRGVLGGESGASRRSGS